ITFCKSQPLLELIGSLEIDFRYCGPRIYYIFFCLGFIKIAPVTRGDASGICRLSAFSENPGLNNIEDLFGIYIAAYIAFALVVISLFNSFLEIFDRLNRVPIIYKVSSGIKYDKLIEHLEYIGGRLMYDDEKEFSLACQFLQEGEDISRDA